MCKTRESFYSLDCQSERLVTQLCPVDEACIGIGCLFYIPCFFMYLLHMCRIMLVSIDGDVSFIVGFGTH